MGGRGARRGRLKVLVLGGTRFVGAAIACALKKVDADITLFTRGRTAPDRFKELHHLRGDRNTDLQLLNGKSFDVVIDTCAYLSSSVATSVAALAGSVKRYVFISSISAYADGPGAVSEDRALVKPKPKFADDAGENYGAQKALAENVILESFGDHATIVRPGLIVGPDDYSDRFTYWVQRIAAGGVVLAPGDGSDPVEWIDARDLAAFTVKLITDGQSGVFNATGPGTRAVFKELLAACPGHENTEIRWASADFLAANQVSPWADMPLWLPAGHSAGHMLRVDNSKAVASGLRLRPLGETALDVLRWHRSLGDRELKAGLTPEREAALLVKLADANPAASGA